MELIDAEALTDFLQATKDNFYSQALNCTDPQVSVKLYAMVHAVDLIMEKVFEGPFDVDSEGETIQ